MLKQIDNFLNKITMYRLVLYCLIFLWFVAIAGLGIRGILSHPQVLYAFSPHFGLVFFIHNGIKGYLILGAIFLVVTGGEALYADMGHFGKFPIRLSWFVLVLPALLMNYLGQGALLIQNHAVTNPFYELAPQWALYPLVVLATSATVIASLGNQDLHRCVRIDDVRKYRDGDRSSPGPHDGEFRLCVPDGLSFTLCQRGIRHPEPQ